MQLLKLAQIYKANNLSKEAKLELARKIDVNYSIPDGTYRNLQNKSYAGYNCLHIAAMKQDHVIVCELLKLGAHPFKQGTEDCRTPIHAAVNVKTNSNGRPIWEIQGKLQECQVVNTLLDAHISSNNPFNHKCKHGMSHLHIASMFNCIKTVEYFLKNREPVNQVTNVDASWSLYTPLHFAIRYASVEVADILLNQGADLYAENAESISPLCMLINRLLNAADYVTMGEHTICVPYQQEFQRLETIARTLIKLKKGNNVNILDDSGLTTFHVACCLRDPSIAESFLDDNIDLNEAVKIHCKFWSGWTPLHFAACSSAETFKLLMQNGASMTITNAKGETPLDFCLKRYTPKTIHSILSTKDHFKSILIPQSSTILLDLLLAMNNMTSFKNYLGTSNQCDISLSFTSPLLPGYSLLHLALSMNDRRNLWYDFLKETDTPENLDNFPNVYSCTEDDSRLHSDRIDVCLAKGCSVDTKNCNGLTPIHLAFKHHAQPDILGKLINHCKEDVVDPDNLSHLHIACALGNQAAVNTLLDAGANVNAVAKKSFQWYNKSDTTNSNLITVHAKSTPLHVAVALEHPDIIDILLGSRADFYATDSKGFMPIHLSMAHKSNKTARMILSRPQQSIELVTKEGLTHMHVAAFAGDADAIKSLFRSGANVNGSIGFSVPDFLSRFVGKTPLEITTQFTPNDALPAVQALIESGAGIYTNDTLQCLMGESDVEFSQPLVDQLKLNGNASRPIHSSGLTLLHVACSRFDVEWATKLLGKGANVNARIRNDEAYKGKWKGYTPLHALLSRKYRCDDSMMQSSAYRLGRLMLNRGSDVTIDSQNGTALHMAYLYQMQKAKRLAQKRTSSPSSAQNQLLNPVAPELVQRFQQAHGFMHDIAFARLPGIARGFIRGLQQTPQAQQRNPRAQFLLNAMERLREARPQFDRLQQAVQALPQAQPPLEVMPAQEQPRYLFDNALGILGEAQRPPEAAVRNLNLDRRWQPMLQDPMVQANPVRRMLMADLQNALDTSNEAQLIQDIGPAAVPQIEDFGEYQDVLERVTDQLEEFGQSIPRFLQLLPQGPAPNPIFQELQLLMNRLGQERTWKYTFESSILYSQNSYQVNPINPDGFSHFHFFCMTDSATIIREFLNNGVDINHSTNPFAKNQAGYTALHFAIKHQAFIVANLLMELGAAVNIENEDGNTPLHLVCLQNLTDKQNDVILSLKRYGANFNAKNMHGETPADVLMTRKNFSLDQLQFLLTNGSSISIKKSSASRGPAELIMRNAVMNERMNIFNLFISVCGNRIATENNYSPVQDVVKAKNDHPLNTLTGDDFVQAIKKFMNADYEIDQVDEKGYTALHNAILHDNVKAVFALLRFGADVNACRLNNDFFESGINLNIKNYFESQVQKMHVFDLYVSDASNSVYLQSIEKISFKKALHRRIMIESEKAGEIKLVGNLTARSFLSDLWGTIYYSKLPPAYRQIIDVFFKNYDYLLQQFPSLCGLMISQYKKALARPNLIDTAKEVLVAECEFNLPDLCLECILSYFTHYELKYLIENAGETETEIPSKRQRIH